MTLRAGGGKARRSAEGEGDERSYKRWNAAVNKLMKKLGVDPNSLPDLTTRIASTTLRRRITLQPSSLPTLLNHPRQTLFGC